MLVGAIALPVGFVLTFAVPPGLAPAASGTWVFVAFLATATAFSLFQVPYIALPAELTRRLRRAHAAADLAGRGAHARDPAVRRGRPELRRAFGATSTLGYLVMAIVAGLVIGAGHARGAVTAPRSDVPPPASRRAASMRAEGYARGHSAPCDAAAPFRALLAAFVLQGLATGLMLAGAQYVATWVLDSEDAVTLLFIALIAPAVLLRAGLGRVARRIGKERGVPHREPRCSRSRRAQHGRAAVGAGRRGSTLPVALAGAAYAGMQSLPMAMLPDVISHDAREHRRRPGRQLRRRVDGGRDRRHGARRDAAHDRARRHRLHRVDRRRRSSRSPPPRSPASSSRFSVVPAALVLLSLVVARALPAARGRHRTPMPRPRPNGSTRDDRASPRARRHPRRARRSCAPPTRPPTADACSRTSTTRASPSSTSSPRRGGAARAAGQRARPDHVHLGRRDGGGRRRLRAPGVRRRRRRGRLGHVRRHRELPARREDRARRVAGRPARHAARAAHRRPGHRARGVPQGRRTTSASSSTSCPSTRRRACPRSPTIERAARRRRRARRRQRAVVPVRDASTRSPTSRP